MRHTDAVCGMRYAVCGMRYAVCGMRYAVCGMRYAVCGMRYAVCGMRYAVCRMPYAVCRMPYAVCRMPYAVCRMPHAACRMRQQMATGNWERIGVIPYVRMRLRFVARIPMRLPGSVDVAIQNASAHETGRKFQGVTSLQTCSPTFTNG